mmetsp:Transcript_30514/g.50709  ORF Transcript_30514/g.50709 Transcript_30514/m.50709 type:complete len:292 (+) Transcript_30514:83-958(+)
MVVAHSERKTSESSTSTVPRLVESLDDDDGDDDDEIVILFDEDLTGGGTWETWGEWSSYSGWNDSTERSHDCEDLLPGYTRSELSRKVTFVKSSKNPTTGEFVRERKTVLWCIQNGCERIQPGVFAGFWYFTYLFGEEEGKRVWIDTVNQRLVKQSKGKAIKIDDAEFKKMMAFKDKGNRSFQRAQYYSALKNYRLAEQLIGGEVMGMYLIASQRAELVKVLSNQAECYLRMKKYEDALSKSTAALKLDSRHEKSILRHTKAISHAVASGQSLGYFQGAKMLSEAHWREKG